MLHIMRKDFARCGCMQLSVMPTTLTCMTVNSNNDTNIYTQYKLKTINIQQMRCYSHKFTLVYTAKCCSTNNVYRPIVTRSFLVNWFKATASASTGDTQFICACHMILQRRHTFIYSEFV